jgi:oxygen-independent coproporphyrinogen-3 oxidase
VPFCASRCGYCAFNTYTTADLGGSALQRAYPAAAAAELRLAAETFPGGPPVAETVFFGGGTPTLLPPDALAAILDAIRSSFGLVPGAEVTVEANPDSVDPRSLAALRAAGFNRISFGMQSVRTHVLAVLDRTHTPGRAEQAVAEARREGFDHINLDLIYGAPGESDDDWRVTVGAAIGTGVDHVSAYALTIEPRTRLAARVRGGRLPAPDDDAQARRYEVADDLLRAAGFEWYELSNWARGRDARCRHNLLYWRNHDWWGVGPGAHSHRDGSRWWNVNHPANYIETVQRGGLAVAARETLDLDQRSMEDILLGIRLAEGLPVARVPEIAVQHLVDEGLVVVASPEGEAGERIVLTRAGRPLADHVVKVLVNAI